MAEERYVATARAPEATDDAETTKEELQRRMEEARESITQTVTEIKDTVSNQYQNVRETISQSLDWREQYRRRPVAFAAGAAGVGLLVGYSVGSAFKSDPDLVERYYEAEGEGYQDEDNASAKTSTGASAQTRAAYAPAAAYPAAESAPAPRPSYSSGYAAQSAPEPDKPGLLERFKESQAYERLQTEIDTLGGRVVNELSKTAQQVVLPALLGRLKDLIGIDLSTQREVAQRSKLEQQTSVAQTAVSDAQQNAPTGSTPPATGGYGSS